MSEHHQFCTFKVDDLYLGVRVESVQEVLRHEVITTVPLASNEMGGLINLRGQIIPAIQLRQRLKLPQRDASAFPMNLIIHAEGEALSLLVDEIGEVISVDSNAFELPPDTLPAALRDMISGVYKLQGQLLLVLRTDRVVPQGMQSAA